MRNRPRTVPGLILALVILIGPGCAGPVDLVTAPNCAERPAERNGLEYWVLGTTGPTLNWSGCEMPGADLRRASLSGAELSLVNLSGANLQGADLSGALAIGARLSEADLRGANVVSLYLRGADLRGANLAGVDLTGVKLSEVDLSGATWTDGTTVCAEGSSGTCRR